MNMNNSIIYFLFGIIILSIIILILLLIESNEYNEIIETNKINKIIKSNKTLCPIHNIKVLQIGLGTAGLSGILLLGNKYFYKNKKGSQGGSYLKKSKIKSFIKTGSNPVDQNFILDDTYIGNKIKRLKDENIEIIKLLKYINIIPNLPTDMNYYYTQENNQAINILNEYKKAFNLNNLYSELKKCYNDILQKQITQLQHEINNEVSKNDKFLQNLKSKAITIFNENVFDRNILINYKDNILAKNYKGNILSKQLFNENVDQQTKLTYFNKVQDLGLNNYDSYLKKLKEIYNYQNRLSQNTKIGNAPQTTKTIIKPVSTNLNKPAKPVSTKIIQKRDLIPQEKKDEFNKSIIETIIPDDKKQKINENINQIEIQNIDSNPIYLYPENRKDINDNIITDLNNKEITYDNLINDLINYNILKEEFISYKIIYENNCKEQPISSLEIISEYIYELSYKLFKLFIKNSCEYFELNTKNDKCKQCFNLINKELSLLRNQLNQSTINYIKINEKYKELEILNLQLIEKNTEYNNRIENLETRINTILDEKSTLKISNTELNQQIDQLNQQITQLKEQIKQLNNENNNYKELNNNLNKSIEELKNKIQELELKINKNNIEIDNKNDKITNLEKEINQLNKKNTELTNITNEEIKSLQIQIQELKKSHNIQIEDLKKEHIDKENVNYKDYKEQLNKIEERHKESITSIELSKKQERENFEKSIGKISSKNLELQNQNKFLMEENEKLKQNTNISNEVSDRIINTIYSDIQSTLDIINKYKTQLIELNEVNKISINKFKEQFTNKQQNNYIKINESDYNNILKDLKSYINELDNSNKFDNSNEFASESDNTLPLELNELIVNILTIIESIETKKIDESNQNKGKLLRQMAQENSDIDFNLKLQNKKDILLNNIKEFNSLITKRSQNKNKLELILKELNKERYFNNSTKLLQDLDKLKVYNDDNIYNLNIFSEYINKFSEGEKWNIQIIDEFKNTYIKNYVTNIMLQIRLYSQIIILNKIFKFVSSLIDSLKSSPLNLKYFNDRLNNIRFNSKYQFNTILGSQGKFNAAETDIMESNNMLTYNDLLDNVLKFLEVSVSETELDIDIPIKYSDIEDKLTDTKFKTANQHLTGFMNLLINKLTKLEIIKDKEIIVNDIIDNSNNLIKNINNKYQNEITNLNSKLNEQKELNNEFNKNINDILSEYYKIIINGYNNFISYGKDYQSKIKLIIEKEKNINKYNKEEYNNKKKEILENLLNLIKSDSNEFLIDNINPISNYDDLIALSMEFTIYIDILLELNNEFIDQILDENKNLNKQKIEYENLINNLTEEKNKLIQTNIELINKLNKFENQNQIIQTYLDTINNNNTKIANYDNELDRLIKELGSDYKLPLENLVNQIITNFKNYQQQEKELSDLSTNNMKLKTQLQSLQKITNEEISKLKKEKSDLLISLASYKLLLPVKDKKRSIIEEEQMKLITENGNLNKKIIDLEQQINQNNQKIEYLKNIEIKYNESIIENNNLSNTNKKLNDQIIKLQQKNAELKREQENKVSELINELTLIKEEISKENIENEKNISKLNNIIKENNILITQLNIKNEELTNQILKLQKENDEYKNKQIEIIKQNEQLSTETEKLDKECNNLEDIIIEANKKYNELEKKYNLNLNELGQIKEIIANYKSKLTEELKKNTITIKEKEDLAHNIIKLQEANLLLKDQLTKQKIELEQKEVIFKQNEKIIKQKEEEIKELKDKIKNSNLNNFDRNIILSKDLKNKEIDLIQLIQQHDKIIQQIKQDNIKLESNLKRQIIELNNENDKLKETINNLNITNSELTKELENLNKLQEEQIQKLMQDLLGLQTENNTLKKLINDLNEAHKLAIQNLTNEFEKIKEKINETNLQNNQKEILKLNEECKNKITILEMTIQELTSKGSDLNIDVQTKIDEINKIKESYKDESEKLKKQNIIYYFKNLSLSKKIQNLNNTIKKLENDKITNNEAKEKIITELNKELQIIKDTLKELDNIKNMNKNYKEELDNCKTSLSDCNTNLSNCKTSLSNCNNDRNSKINSIEQYKNELGLKDNIIDQIQKDKQNLQERLNVLNDILAKTSTTKIDILSKENIKLNKENQDLKNELNSIKTSVRSTSSPTSSLPPIIDEYGYYYNHPYITNRSNKLIENIYNNDPYSNFIKTIKNE